MAKLGPETLERRDLMRFGGLQAAQAFLTEVVEDLHIVDVDHARPTRDHIDRAPSVLSGPCRSCLVVSVSHFFSSPAARDTMTDNPNPTPETLVPDAWTWIAVPPGGPADPFWSIVRGDGRVVALQVPDEATALMLVRMKMGLENAYAILRGQGDVSNARAIDLALGHLVKALGGPE